MKTGKGYSVKSIKIGHINYEIKVVKKLKKDGEKLHGYIDYNKEELLICNKFKKKYTETMIHEILHGMSNFLGINLKESQVISLANCLVLLFQENPALKKLL